jgi:hypothetical protein
VRHLAQHDRHGVVGVGHHQLARRQRADPGEALSGPRQAQPERAVDLVGVEREHRHARLGDRERQRVVDDVLALQPAVAQALQRDRLHRRAIGVRVDPNLAREHPVGPGDRVLAHVDHLPAGVAVGQQAEPLLHRRGARTRPHVDRRVHEPQLRELLGQLSFDPAL